MKRWVTSGDRKSVVTCSQLSRLQFSSSVYKILIGSLVNTSVYISLTLGSRVPAWEQLLKTNTPLLWLSHFKVSLHVLGACRDQQFLEELVQPGFFCRV